MAILVYVFSFLFCFSLMILKIGAGMFTGIIDHCGEITAIEKTNQGLRLAVSSQFTNLIPGESVAVDGVCLTVTDPKAQTFCLDLSKETLDLTTASQWCLHQKVNLERAMRASDRFGGHYVTGHVETVAIVASVEVVGDCVQILFAGIDSKNKRYLLEKGSVCVNGVSLTINSLSDNGFRVMLIPHTLLRTNLQFLKTNDQVNIEFDWMVKTVLSHLNEKVLTYATS